MKSKKRFCSCGRITSYNEQCKCKQVNDRSNYQKDYYQKNKELLKPLTSKRWRQMRKMVIQEDGGVCQRCFIKFEIINSTELQVHHIKPRIEFPELMYERSNLITICKTCNLQLGLKELDFDRKEIDTNNEVNL